MGAFIDLFEHLHVFLDFVYASRCISWWLHRGYIVGGSDSVTLAFSDRINWADVNWAEMFNWTFSIVIVNRCPF